MAHPPLVSVAIVTYNHEAYIREAIEGALAQDYPNIEFIVADDCSTDRTVEIVAEYPVRLIRAERNQGITANTNVAHHACQGDFIAWLGGDDVMLPGKISAQVEAMKPGVNLCYHDLDVFDETGNLYRFNERFHPRVGRVTEAIRHGSFNGACATMVRRSTAQPFDDRLPLASDWLYFVQAVGLEGTIAYIPKILGRYRKHAASATAIDDGRGLLDHIHSCNILLETYPTLAPVILQRRGRLLLSLARRRRGRDRLKYILQAVASIGTGFVGRSA